MKNTYFKTVLALTALVFVFACSDEEEFTGDSTMTPSNPSLSVTLDFPSTQTLVEMDATYDFTVNLSAPTIAAVDVKIAQTGGTATEGIDFEIPHSIRIAAGATSATGTITIIADDLVEETENAIITIGSGFEANVSATNSQTVTFNIANLEEGDLVVGLDWTLSETLTDNFGNEIGAYDAADLRLLLTDVPYTTIFDEADGASAETYTLDGAAPDGEYYFVADFYSATDVPSGLNLTATFDQVGLINGTTFNFSSALTTELTCAEAYFVLAKVTKVGTNYTIEEVGEANAAPSISGTYNVVSNGLSTDPGPVNNPLVDFMSTVIITDNGNGTYTFSDGWGGVYVDWYTIYGYTILEEQTISLNVCLELSGSWDDLFGGGNSLSGTVNADGTLSVRLDNVYGDYVDAVYTLQ